MQPDKIMHCTLNIGSGVLMASDCQAEGKAKFQGVSIALAAPDEATIKKYYSALSKSGQVQMPLSPTFFSSLFAVVTDKFGLTWMLTVQQDQPNG